jgi:alpha-L-arabinofuranosidase
VIAGQDSVYASAVIDRSSNEIVLKLVNTNGAAQNREIVFDGASNLNSNALVTILKGNQLAEMNSITEPFKIKPVNEQIQLKDKTLSLAMTPYSVNVVRIKIR